jgi:hypothetical protein
MKLRWAGLRASKPIGRSRGAVNTRSPIFRGQRFGAASKPRRLSDAERRAIEEELRRSGQLQPTQR